VIGSRLRRGRTAIFLAVQDAQVGVFDDDGDDLAGVAWAWLDALFGDHDLAVGVYLALRP
jgi:hypothetical protein